MSEHATTALDQLALADSLVDTWEQQLQHALVAAQVHALLEVAAAVKLAGAMALQPVT